VIRAAQVGKALTSRRGVKRHRKPDGTPNAEPKLRRYIAQHGKEFSPSFGLPRTHFAGCLKVTTRYEEKAVFRGMGRLVQENGRPERTSRSSFFCGYGRGRKLADCDPSDFEVHPGLPIELLAAIWP